MQTSAPNTNLGFIQMSSGTKRVGIVLITLAPCQLSPGAGEEQAPAVRGGLHFVCPDAHSLEDSPGPVMSADENLCASQSPI